MIMYGRKLLLGLVLLLMMGFLAGIFYYAMQEQKQEYGKKSTLVWAEGVRL